MKGDKGRRWRDEGDNGRRWWDEMRDKGRGCRDERRRRGGGDMGRDETRGDKGRRGSVMRGSRRGEGRDEMRGDNGRKWDEVVRRWRDDNDFEGEGLIRNAAEGRYSNINGCITSDPFPCVVVMVTHPVTGVNFIQKKLWSTAGHKNKRSK